MGKVPKMTDFGNFAPVNLKSEKNDIAYRVGNFFSKILAKIFVSKKVILTALWRHKVVILANFRPFGGINYGFRLLTPCKT